MKLEDRTTWHYAVFMARTIFMEPCCMIIRNPEFPWLGDHGMTKLRGDVNCENCKKAMGMP